MSGYLDEFDDFFTLYFAIKLCELTERIVVGITS